MKDLVVIRPYETAYGLYRDKEVKIIKKEELLDMDHNFDILWDLDNEKNQIKETNKSIKIIHEQGYSYWRSYSDFYYNYEFSKLSEKLRETIATAMATAKKSIFKAYDDSVYTSDYWCENTILVRSKPFLYEKEFDSLKCPELVGKKCFTLIGNWCEPVYVVEGYTDFFCTLVDDEGKFYLHNCGPYLEKAIANNIRKRDYKKGLEERLVKICIDVQLGKGVTLGDFCEYINHGVRRDDFFIAGIDETERPIISNINEIDQYEKTIKACEDICSLLQKEIAWNKDRLKELRLDEDKK